MEVKDEEKEFSEHLEELRKRIIRVAIVIVIISAASLTLSMKEVDLGFKIWLPYPDPMHNIATQVILSLQEQLVPTGVQIIQTAPGQAFYVQIYVSVLLGIMLGMPIIVREIGAFISPALHKREMETIAKVTLPSIGLFILGCIFAYLVVIPFMLGFLYKYGETLGAVTFLSITDFISFVMQFLIAFGLSFELPIIMWAITLSGLVEASFWARNLRYAVVILVIFGAIITPDGSGVTMWFISLPMIILYITGMVIIRSRAKVQN